jgi:tRNA nucleotidyltransferase (CCA-adding enzyme)
VYLVGGAVRDAQLGIPHQERDWCVVGAAPAELEALGYQRVGKDFPVFLHPETKDSPAPSEKRRPATTVSTLTARPM